MTQDTTHKTSPCKGCGAAIIWCNGAHGANVPIDARSVQQLEEQGVISVLRASFFYFLDDNDPPNAIRFDGIGQERQRAKSELYISHFITCPKRADFSRKNKKR